MGNKKNFVLGALVAGAAGYVAGILTAPKSGKETREDIKVAALKAKTEAEKKLKALNAELNVLIDRAAELAKQSKGKAAEEIEKLKQQAVTARQKARDILSAIHEGDVEDEDLQQAVAEARSATEHLKKYLEKKSV